MASVRVTREFDHPVEKVWGLVSDFANISWMPAGTECRVEGEGPGMIRHIAAGPGLTLPETLESVDDATRTLVYTIPGELPFPASDYRSTMVVREVEREKGAGSELEWSCSYEPKGDAAQAQAAMEGLYGTLIGWVADALDK
jgi:uncharacterized protein YndB with AHSA1/START domain